jgi:hypothetical protein
MAYTFWKKNRFSERVLHYIKQNAKGDKLLTFNKHVREKLESGGQVLKMILITDYILFWYKYYVSLEGSISKVLQI